jgi:hypothetical protein
VTRASVGTGGTEAVPPPSPGGYYESEQPTISEGGRFVSFESTGIFAPGDTGEDGDAFVHDRTTGDTTWVSVHNDGTEADTGFFLFPFISGNGNFVALRSTGQFTADDTDNLEDVFIRGPLF